MPKKLGVSPAELIARYPRLYHMAERDSLPSILKHGLLSTSSLLDLYAVNGERRMAIESDVRGQSIAIEHSKFGTAVVRDQCLPSARPYAPGLDAHPQCSRVFLG